MINGNTILQVVIVGIIGAIGASALHSLRESGRIYSLFTSSQEKLTETEEIRVDKLLNSAKMCHNYSLLISGILIALSSLDVFQYFKAPFGEIVFPKVQTFIGLFFLMIVLLIAMDRYFLMAYPWMLHDKRRPPFDWIVLGFSFNSKYSLWIWKYIPILLSTIALTISLANEFTLPGGSSFTIILMCGISLVLFPPTIYYYNHLIKNKLDHRGGSSTLSINLLYRYRIIRQILFEFLVTYPILIILPTYKGVILDNYYLGAIILLLCLYLLRWIFSIKFIYKRIDKLGKRYGYPIESHHYK